MSSYSIEAWDDEERQREDDWRDAWDALDDEEQPRDTCPACYDAPEQCSVCRCIPARPEGGERDE